MKDFLIGWRGIIKPTTGATGSIGATGATGTGAGSWSCGTYILDSYTGSVQDFSLRRLRTGKIGA